MSFVTQEKLITIHILIVQIDRMITPFNDPYKLSTIFFIITTDSISSYGTGKQYSYDTNGLYSN